MQDSEEDEGEPGHIRRARTHSTLKAVQFFIVAAEFNRSQGINMSRKFSCDIITDEAVTLKTLPTLLKSRVKITSNEYDPNFIIYMPGIMDFVQVSPFSSFRELIFTKMEHMQKGSFCRLINYELVLFFSCLFE